MSDHADIWSESSPSTISQVMSHLPGLSSARIPLPLRYPLSKFPPTDPHPAPWLPVSSRPHCIQNWAQSYKGGLSFSYCNSSNKICLAIFNGCWVKFLFRPSPSPKPLIFSLWPNVVDNKWMTTLICLRRKCCFHPRDESGFQGQETNIVMTFGSPATQLSSSEPLGRRCVIYLIVPCSV